MSRSDIFLVMLGLFLLAITTITSEIYAQEGIIIDPMGGPHKTVTGGFIIDPMGGGQSFAYGGVHGMIDPFYHPPIGFAPSMGLRYRANHVEEYIVVTPPSNEEAFPIWEPSYQVPPHIEEIGEGDLATEFSEVTSPTSSDTEEYIVVISSEGTKVIYNDGRISDFNKALEIDPHNAEAYSNSGIKYLEQGQYDLAIRDFSKALEIDPNNAEAYSNRGAVFFEKGQYNLAIRDFNKALEINSNLAVAYSNRGAAQWNLGLDRQAIKDFRTAARLGNENAQSFLTSEGITW